MNRRSLTIHPKQSGLISSINWSTRQLRYAQLYKLVAGIDAKWKYFPIFGAGLQLRCFNAAFASLLIPHTECPSEFYSKTLEIYRKICSITPVMKPVSEMTYMYTVSSGTLNSTIPYHTIPYHTSNETESFKSTQCLSKVTDG